MLFEFDTRGRSLFTFTKEVLLALNRSICLQRLHLIFMQMKSPIQSKNFLLHLLQRYSKKTDFLLTIISPKMLLKILKFLNRFRRFCEYFFSYKEFAKLNKPR